MKPGIYPDISNKNYHSGPGISSSDLKELLRSPAHYRAYKANPIEPTAEMIRGTLLHTLILEPHMFEHNYAVGSFNIRRGKDYEKVVSENPGKIILSAEELTEATVIYEAFKEEVHKNPELQMLLDGDKECSYYWKDKNTGTLCKARPDIVNVPRGTIVDLKTTKDASFDAFQRQVVDLKYFLSASYYLRGVNEVANADVTPISRFVFVALETKPPYAVALYYLDAKAIEMGDRFVDKALQSYCDAVWNEDWRGYPKAPIEMALPNYFYYKYSAQ